MRGRRTSPPTCRRARQTPRAKRTSNMFRNDTAQDAPIVKVNAMTVSKLTRHAVLAALAAQLLGGCAYLDRLRETGQQPALSSVDNPTTRPGYKPVQMPMPAAQPASYNPNSLWRNGSRAFFK